MQKKIHHSLITLAQGAVFAALYFIAAMLTAPIAFGIIQFRISEALTALPILFPGAVPGVFVGCFLSNLLNPLNLGVIDIVCGSLATGGAAVATYFLGKAYRRRLFSVVRGDKAARPPSMFQRLYPLAPPVVLNALVVGLYLPYLLQEGTVTLGVVLLSMLSIFVSQTVAVYGLGLPFLMALERTSLVKLVCRQMT